MLFRGLIATDLSGSIAGVTASRNKGGAYFRERVTPVNPNSTQQAAVRALMSSLTAIWRDTLDAAERELWNVYGQNTPMTNRIGETVFISGLSHYIRSNIPRMQAGLARIDAAPTSFGLAEAGTIAVTGADEGTQLVAFTFDNSAPWAGASGGHLLVYVSRPQGPATNFFKGPYRFAGRINGAPTPPSSPASVTAPFVFAAGQRVFARFRASDAEGRLSTDFRDFVLAS